MWREAAQYLHRTVEPVHVLARTKVAVHGSQKPLHTVLSDVPVKVSDPVLCPADDSAVHVDAVKLDVNTYPFHALRRVLAVELLLVQPRAQRGQPTAQLRHHVGKEGRLVLHDENHVIHEPLVVYAERQYPLVYFVEIVVHGVLPNQVANSCTDAVWLVEQAFLRLDLSPLP